MIAKKEVNQSQEYERSNKQMNVNKIQNKRKRTTRKQAYQDGKVLIQCQYCPSQHKRKYQSYPALYTHVNIKHPGCKISSAKEKQKIDIYPVFKMMNILKKQFPQNQQIQRNLISLKSITCLLLAGQLLKKQQYCNLTYKEQDESLINKAIQNAFVLAEQININQQYFKIAQKGKIFEYQYTKVFPISFGQGVTRYFCKKIQYSSRIYVSLIVIECFDQNLITNEQKERFETLIWGQNVKPINILIEYWQKWKEILIKHYNFLGQARQFEQKKI